MSERGRDRVAALWAALVGLPMVQICQCCGDHAEGRRLQWHHHKRKGRRSRPPSSSPTLGALLAALLASVAVCAPCHRRLGAMRKSAPREAQGRAKRRGGGSARGLPFPLVTVSVSVLGEALTLQRRSGALVCKCE